MRGFVGVVSRDCVSSLVELLSCSIAQGLLACRFHGCITKKAGRPARTTHARMHSRTHKSTRLSFSRMYHQESRKARPYHTRTHALAHAQKHTLVVFTDVSPRKPEGPPVPHTHACTHARTKAHARAHRHTHTHTHTIKKIVSPISSLFSIYMYNQIKFKAVKQAYNIGSRYKIVNLYSWLKEL